MGSDAALLWVKNGSAWVPVKGDSSGYLLAGRKPPVAKARIFNTAMPAAGVDWLATAITPTATPSFALIYICTSKTGLLTVRRTVGGVTAQEYLNGGSDIQAYYGYMFTVPWRSGDSLNFRYSPGSGTTLCFDVVEVEG